ncbi:MAG: hypothetical protein WCD12_01670 [Candidatus Binatus sp.]|uniref:hypothetical protein n=1 Tax=Candidatus Binatus sp. TaxID=2811406 RepID=UPI003C741F3A
MNEQRSYGAGWGLDLVRFTLTYDGPLPSGGNSSHLPIKQRIRQTLHPQIRSVWRNHPAFDEDELLKAMVENEDRFINRGRFTFIPIVRRYLHLFCEIDILLLRREAPGAIVHRGDLDNRLKILFDALRAPNDPSELKGLRYPRPKGKAVKLDGHVYPPPFFCLLEDDALITGVKVDTAQLFEPLKRGTENHVRLVMRVSVKLSKLTKANLAFVGD